MPKVKGCKEKTGGRVELLVEICGKICKYTVSFSIYEALGSPFSEYELTEEELEAIASDDEEHRAMKKALSLLSYSDNNRKNLYMKLCRAGFSKRSAALAVEECLRLGYVDEHRQLERLIATEANQNLRGGIYIRNKLAAKGYSPSQIDRVWCELVERGEIDLEKNLEQLYYKRGALTEEEKKALRFKYGYSSFDL